VAALPTGLSDVSHAEDGRDALAKAIGILPAIVVTEAKLPFFNGDILCSLLRADPLTSNIRLIVITRDDSSTIVDGRRWDADRVLAAPVQQHVLSRAVSETLHRAPEPSVQPGTSLETESYSVPAMAAPRSRRPRFTTSTTPLLPPPALRCPSCDLALRYVVSHTGGTLTRREQWDIFECRTCSETHEYRQRTRALRRVK
jgi:DNA-binding NarL/FixJ family response regulator